jgi:TonB family protein
VVNNDWLDIEVLEDYLDGKLDSKAMHQVERQALEDPFVAQALAGLSESPRRAAKSVSLLQKQLYERIAEQQVQKKRTVYTWQRLSIAAAAAVMFISVSIVFVMRVRQNREQLARTQPKVVEVNIAPAVIPSSGISAPVGGWVALDKYIRRNNQLAQTSKPERSVEVTFSIDKSGKPLSIEVTKSAAKDLDREAIRLISEGPLWEQPSKTGGKVSYTIVF